LREIRTVTDRRLPHIETGTASNQIRLPDGRFLGYAEDGDLAGAPLFYFHGFPGSRVEGKLIGPLAAASGVRLISMDRPGYGISSMQPRRKLSDWPRDVAALADQLGIGRFSVVGVSGGSPYAAGCAAALPDRVIAAAIVCGVGPFNAPGAVSRFTLRRRLGIYVARHCPWIISPVYRTFATRIEQNPQQVIELLCNRVPEPDRQVLSQTAFREVLAASFREAFRQGSAGFAHDLHLYCKPWDIPLAQIRVPVFLWHGELDATVPVGMGRYLAATIPGCKAVFLPEDGHYSLPANCMESVLAELQGCAAADDPLKRMTST